MEKRNIVKYVFVLMLALFCANMSMTVAADEAYIISFDKGDEGASGTMESVEYYGGAYTLPECGFTPPEGGEFFFWQVGDDPGSQYKPGEKIQPTESVVVTAVYRSADGYLVWVGGTQVTPDNADDVTGDGTVSYDGGTGTLIFANEAPALQATTLGALIYAETGALIVETPGRLVLESDTAAYAVKSTGAVTINGDVRADISGNAIIESRQGLLVTGSVEGTNTQEDGYGLVARGKIAVTGSVDLVVGGGAVGYQNGTNEIEIGGDFNVESGALYTVFAINSVKIDGNVTLRNPGGTGIYVPSGQVLIGGDAYIRVTGSDAIFGFNGISVLGNVDAENQGAVLFNAPYGAVSVGGDLTAKASGAYLVTCAKDITIEGIVTGDSKNGAGFYSREGSVVIRKSATIQSVGCCISTDVGTSIISVGGDSDLTSKNAQAIKAGGSVDLQGNAVLTATASDIIFASKDIKIAGGVEAVSSNGSGFFSASGNIEIGGSVTMTTKGNCLGTDENDGGKVTVGADAHLSSTGGCVIKYGSGVTIEGDAEFYGNDSDYLLFSLGDMYVGGNLTGENTGGGGPYVPIGGLTVAGDVNLKARGRYLLLCISGITIGGSVTGENTEGNGLYCPSGSIHVEGDVDVKANGNHLVYVYGGNFESGNVTGSNPGGYGIWVEKGNTVINGDVTISSYQENISSPRGNRIDISGDAELTSSINAVIGICSDLHVGGSFNATANGGTIVLALNSIEIGGDVTAVNLCENGDGLFVPDGKLTIPEGGTWHITADRSAISTSECVVIPEGSRITEPQDGEIRQYEPEYYPYPFYVVWDGSDAASEVVIEPDPANAITLKSATVEFDGLIRIRYTCSIPEGVAAEDGAYLAFEKSGETVLTTPLADGIPSGEDTYFYFPVPAPEFADDVILRAYDGEGNPIRMRSANGTDYTEDGFAYSAKTYAERMEQSSSAETMRNLAHALFDYGTAAQIYFKHGDYSGLASDEHVANVTADDLAAYKLTALGAKPAGISGASISAQFNYDNSLRVTFKLDGSHAASDYAFYVDDAPAWPEIKGGNAVLTVTQIAAPDLDKAHTFTVTDGADTYTVTASVLSYALTSVKNGDESRANLGRAVYLYYKAADPYFE